LGQTIIPNHFIKNKKMGKFIYRKTQKGLILPGPRSTNEIFVTSETRGAFPGNEKDATKICLSDENAAKIALHTLYGNAK
jgi:hypothetical protein